MIRCARCDFRTEDDEEAEEHARDSGHYRCAVCQRRFLAEHERQTCGICIGNIRADLAELIEGYALLRPEGTHSLTLLGDGTMQHVVWSGSMGLHDWSWDSDPLPVLPALTSWEDFIREHYKVTKRPSNPTLSEVTSWLTQNLDTRLEIAQTFPAFDEFAAEVRKHRSAVRHAAGLVDDPLGAPARCFECGEPLIRTYEETNQTAESRQRRKEIAAYIVRAAEDEVAARKASRSPHPIRYARREAEELLGSGRRGTTGEGLTDDWTCSGCRNIYDQQSYFLALKAHATEAPGQWRPLSVAAWLVDRPFRTVQTWARGLVVSFACDVESKRRVVWMPDVKQADLEDKERAAKRAAERERRKREREERESRQAS